MLASVGNREFMIPSVRSHLNHNAQDLGGASGKPLRQRYDNETDICLGGIGSKIYVNEQRIEKPDFYMPRGLDRYGPAAGGEERLLSARLPRDAPAATCSRGWNCRSRWRPSAR